MLRHNQLPPVRRELDERHPHERPALEIKGQVRFLFLQPGRLDALGPFVKRLQIADRDAEPWTVDESARPVGLPS